jgi:hypothetical protein
MTEFNKGSFRMKKIVLAASLLLSVSAFAGLNYTNTTDLTNSTNQHKLVDAEYKLIPTKTETHWKPGCSNHGEGSQDCTETIVIESEPAIAVNVSYVDSTFSSEGNEVQWATVLMDPQTFPTADVEALKAKSPAWQHPFSNEGRKFAKNNLALQVAKVEKAIQVLDMSQSRICPIGEEGVPRPGCVEHLVYKTSWTKVKQLTLVHK